MLEPQADAHRAVPCWPSLALPGRAQLGACRLSSGIDLVQVSTLADSMQTFGARFTQRLFTPAELAYAQAAPVHTAQRLAARFAAKEAALKALSLSDAGIDWREIETTRQDDGACQLALHGKAGALARAAGLHACTLSLSHEGDYACAVVVCVFPLNPSANPLNPS